MSKSQKRFATFDYASPDIDAGPPLPLTDDEELHYKQYLYEVSTYGSGSDFVASCVAWLASFLAFGALALILPRWAWLPVALGASFFGYWLRETLVELKWSRFEKDHHL